MKSLVRISGVTLLLLALTPSGPGAITLPAGGASSSEGRAPAAGAATARKVIVVCAPGYPGNTVEAQPTMDLFAKYVEKAAGLAAGSLGAVYYETEKGGLDRLAASDAVLALVPWPFCVQHAKKLSLTPMMSAEPDAGAGEEWSLVAKKGRVKSASSLAGWELTSRAGYAPAFVREQALASWGSLPATTKITFTAGILAALRRVVAGENLVVLLDREQTASLASLPFAKDVEIVARSKVLPSSILCLVSGRLAKDDAARIERALLEMHQKPEGADLLKTMRLKRFVKYEKTDVAPR